MEMTCVRLTAAMWAATAAFSLFVEASCLARGITDFIMVFRIRELKHSQTTPAAPA
jgi:hypothetical protein